MSNHEGSYLLNEVIGILDGAKVFELLGKEKSQELVLRITRRGTSRHDCNAYEILEGYEERLGICHVCVAPAKEIEDGVCVACRKEWNREPR
jgi:hypothetical protein